MMEPGCDRETLRQFTLSNSLNRMDDLVRNGLIGVQFHAMAVCIWRASRMEWPKARDYVNNQLALGFILPEEIETVLSVLAEICPSYND